MKARTLVAHLRYFGVEPMKLRAAAGRVLARVVGLPPARAHISAAHLRLDFALDTVEGERLARNLVEGGLLRPHGERQGDYQVTPRLLEYASARVVAPLQRPRAKLLLDKACRLAAEINAEWSRNPLEIEVLAVMGSYMSRDHELADLTLGIVVRPRPRGRSARFSQMLTKAAGAEEIRAVMQNLSSFVVVHMATRTASLTRPFSVAFQADKP